MSRHERRYQWWLYGRRVTGWALLVLAVAAAWCLVVVSIGAVLLVAELEYPP